MASIGTFGRQETDCASCGDCTNGVPNGTLPDFYAMVVGAARVGGIPPLSAWLWLAFFTSMPSADNGDAQNWWDLEPTGINNGSYRTMEFTATATNDTGGITTQYQKFIFHPVMGDMYWAFQSSTSSPARLDDYTYEWKLLDTCELYVVDSTGSGDTARPTPFGKTFTHSVIDDWTWSHFLAHERDDVTSTVEWSLSDPITLQSVFTDASIGAKALCDEVDIASDGAAISIDGSPSTATSDLTDDFAVTKSARIFRVACRINAGGAGVVNRNRNLGDATGTVWSYGAGVMLLAEYGDGVAGCCTSDQFVGVPWAVFMPPTTLTGYASKIKFAFHHSGWCHKKYKLQACQDHEFQYNGSLACVDAGCIGGYYDYSSLRWVVYPFPAADLAGPPTSGNQCAGRPEDDIVAFGRLHLGTCETISGTTGSTGNVSDLPQPCTSGLDICAGGYWYYDYTACDLQGIVIFDGSNCGANCGCSTTDIPALHAEMPDLS